MASVKINFPNPHATYMHDTPQQTPVRQADALRSRRAACACRTCATWCTWLLRDTPGWDRQRFEATIKSGESTPVQLSVPVPVHFTYISAWSTGDGVAHFRDDIYALDGVDELQIT